MDRHGGKGRLAMTVLHRSAQHIWRLVSFPHVSGIRNCWTGHARVSAFSNAGEKDFLWTRSPPS